MGFSLAGRRAGGNVRPVKIWLPILSILSLAVAVQLTRLWRENESLHARLIESRRQIEALRTNLASVSARLEASEKRQVSSATPTPGAVPLQVKTASPLITTEGSFTREEGAIVYGPDAKVRLENGDSVSSPSGVMVSDQDQKIIVGDLKLENATSSIEAINASLDVDKHMFFGQSPVIRFKKSPEKKK